MQENTNLYWKQHSLLKNIMVPTRTVLHPCLDVVRITDVQDIPKTICNRVQAEDPHKETLLV